MHAQPILVIGKNGKTGARVESRLTAKGLSTRAVSRSTLPLFDWEDPDSWMPALSGTRAAYVTFQPDLAVPSAEATIRTFVQQAVEAGLEHVVLLSGRGEDGALRAESILQSSGLAWNVVRASWFAQNFSESFMLEGILSGHLALPAGPVLEPFIDVDDIADVAVAALTRPDLRNRVFEVTGPRALTFAQCVEEISNAVGYRIEYSAISVDNFVGEMREQGAPEDMQWLMRELFSVVLDGRNSRVMDGVEEALGRPATDFSSFIKKAITSGVWDRGAARQQT